MRNWTTLGYTYPEFVDSDGSSASIISYVNNFYGPSATATAGSSKAKRTAMPAAPAVEERATPAYLEEREIPTSEATPDVDVDLLSTPTGERYEYTANIAVNRFGLDSPFVVYIFFGNFSENVADWAFDANLVGSYGIFAMSGMTHHVISVSGAVPLTEALTTQISAGNLANMSHEAVVPFLRTEMAWRIATVSLSLIQIYISLLTTSPTDQPSLRQRGQCTRPPSLRRHRKRNFAHLGH